MVALIKRFMWRLGQLTTIAGVLLTFAQIASQKGFSSDLTTAMRQLFGELPFDVWLSVGLLICASCVLLFLGHRPHTIDEQHEHHIPRVLNGGHV